MSLQAPTFFEKVSPMHRSSFGKTRIRLLSAILLILSLIVTPGRAAETPKDAHYWSRHLGKTLNIPGTLNFRKRLWVLNEDHLQKIKNAGFTAVRVPVGWQWHVESDAPHAIDPAFLEKVDRGLRWGLNLGLVMVLDFHAGLEFGDFSAPEKREMFRGIWEQLAQHYRDWPDPLLFEILNEPRGMSMEDWNTWQKEAIAIIRETNPRRTLIVGSIEYNKAEHLATLELPEHDRNLIVTWHLYVPYAFAQQGVILRKTGKPRPAGVSFGFPDDRKQIEDKVTLAVAYTRTTGRPTWCGEFGVTRMAPSADALEWIRHSRTLLEKHDISWGYWEFVGKEFGLFDAEAGTWNVEKLEALGLLRP